MNAEHAQELLEKLGCERIKLTSNGWVNACCPFAPFSDKHRNKRDSNPSFGVSVSDGKSGYRCFTCNAKGSLSDLVMRLHHLVTKSGQESNGFYELLGWVQARDIEAVTTPRTLLSRLESADYRPYVAVEVGGIKLSEKTATKLRLKDADVSEETISEADLLALPDLTDEALEYLLKERGLSVFSVDDWQLRWHPKTRRVAIPIRDCTGRLVGISGRAIDSKTKPKFLHSSGYNRDLYLYGEHRLQEGGTGTGIVVEGFFDAIHLWQHGYKAVAILGSYPSRVQIEKLVRFFGDIVILPDGDAAGRDAAERIRVALGQRIPVRIADMRDGYDPDDLSPLDLAEALKVVA